jgi:hypothetical protein
MRSPRAELVEPPGEETPGALQDVSYRLWTFYHRSSNLIRLLTPLSAFSKAHRHQGAQPCALEAPGAERASGVFRAPSPALEHRVVAGAG